MRSRAESGFVLITLAVSMLALVGVMGLAIDLGHLYVVKAEAQTFSDLTALAAVQELDGTIEGLERARERVKGYPMRWSLQQTPSETVRVEFSGDDRNWEQQPRSAVPVKFLRVTAELDKVELFFLPAVIPNKTASIRAQAVAVQTTRQAYASESGRMLPFAVLAHDATDSEFGFRPGDRVTLRWPAADAGLSKPCEADQEQQWVANARSVSTAGTGYTQLATPDGIREAIEDDRVFVPVAIGRPVEMTGGDIRLQADALRARIQQDTNSSAETYGDYRRRPGNGRRIGVVAVADPKQQLRVVGFATVFLAPVEEGGNPSTPLCAEYAGNTDRSQEVAIARLLR
ncbi:MAG: pilus assembly protein TadG-related protein [Bryobacteraceae bacterium]